jgi:hypothetical protein
MNDESEDRSLIDDSDDRPLLDDVSPVPWNPQAEASYEANVELINRRIAELAEQIFDERHKDYPDQGRIDVMLKNQLNLSTEVATLRVGAPPPLYAQAPRSGIRMTLGSPASNDGLAPA